MYKLDTPESVAVTYPIAGVGSRFLAALIDSVVQTAVVVALYIVFLVIAGVSAATGGNGSGGTAGYVALAIGALGVSAVLLGYYIFFEVIWNGQSPGKRAMRLRVIGINGYPVTPFAVLIRNVLRLIDFLPAYYAVGVVAMLANKNSRRLGDLAAGTIVVKEGREGALSALPGVYQPTALPGAPAGRAYGSAAAPASPTFGMPLPPPGPSAGLGGGSSSGMGNPSPYAGGAPPAYPSYPTYPTSPAYPTYGAPSAPTPTTGAFGQGAAAGAPAADTYGIDASRLTREDAALIRDFLDRRHTLAYDRRNALAYQIAALVYSHAGGDTRHFTAEGYLEHVLRLARGQ